MNDKAREAFEAHMKADWRGRESAAWRNPDGSYIYTESEWRAFQAALQWQAEQQKGEADARSCTCHPDDSPPNPCPKRYALGECRAASPHGVPPLAVQTDLEPEAFREHVEAVIACLGDDAASLRADNDEDERAFNMDAAAELLERLLSSLPQAPQGEQWISVHERLPELNADNEDDGIKVYTWDGEFVTEDVFAPEYEQPAGPAVGGWLRTGDWFCSDTATRVTHWMLRRQPAPPPLAQGGRE